MRTLLFLVAISVGNLLNAQRNIFDPFSDNSNNWPLTAGSEGSMSIAGGYYEVTTVSEGYWQYTHTIEHGFDKHFRIEASVERDSATAAGKGAGIVWGNKADSTRFAFLVYGDGSFVYQYLSNGVSETVSPHEVTYAYNEEGYNNLRVERNMVTNMYDLSVNEQLVLSVPYRAPRSSEAGIYADMAGKFRFDNFWFIEQANTDSSYRPHELIIDKRCGDKKMQYSSDYGYSFCVPFGWRVDEYRETHCSIWPVGCAYVINLDYTKLAIEDSFGVAAKNDFKIFVDSLKVSEKQFSEIRKDSSSPGTEVWAAQFQYVGLDHNTVTVYRYYVYHAKSGGFMLIEATVPPYEEELAMMFSWVSAAIAESVIWE